jgi:hypothetical protein
MLMPSALTLTDSLITQLTTTHAEKALRAITLLEKAERIPDGTVLPDFRSVLSWETWYGTTAGPFPGMGGAAMTWFRMTVLISEHAMLLFASNQVGDRFYGAAPFDAAVIAAPTVEAFDLFVLGAP